MDRERDAKVRIARDALRAETGIQDDAVLDALREIGVDRDTLPAVEWIPLVLVAWADGIVTSPVRDVILRTLEGDRVPEQLQIDKFDLHSAPERFDHGVVVAIAH